MGTKIYDAETQFLTIAYAKDAGLDRQHRVVYFNPNENSREEVGLTALLVYSVVAPAYSVHSRFLVDARKPESITGFLAVAWSQNAELGMPLSLEIKPQLITADLGYAAWVQSLGIELKPSSSIKSITAFEKASLDIYFATQWGQSQIDTPQKLDQANAAIQKYSNFLMRDRSRKSVVQQTFQAWNNRDKRFYNDNSRKPIQPDWDASSLAEHTRWRPSARLIVRSDEYPEFYVDSIKEISEMWPGGRRAFFKRLIISQKEFDYWCSGRSNLRRTDFAQIRALTNIEYDEDTGELELGGGYLLMATTAKTLKNAYNSLSHGGDLQFSFEVLGPLGERPVLRFLIFQNWRGMPNIILFERGGPAEKALNERNLINLKDPVHAPPNVWKTVTKIIDLRDKFTEPEKIGASFAVQHNVWLDKMTSF